MEGPPTRRTAPTPTTWVASAVAHVALALALRLVPLHVTPDTPVVDLAPVEIDLNAPLPPEPPPVEPPPVEPPAAPVTPLTPAPAARAERPVTRRAASTPTTEAAGSLEPAPVAPAVTPVMPAPAPLPTPAPLPRAADLLRASSALAVTGASEGWLAPAPRAAPNRNIYGGSVNGEPPTPERLREIAGGPTRAALAGSVRDHRPAGAGEHDRFVARRALEAFDVVRELPGLGAAVRRAPEVTVAGVQRSVSGGERGIADNFDAQHGTSFSGMTMNTRMPDLSYRVLRADVEVEEDASGAIRVVRTAHASGMRALDALVERAIREAMLEHSWRAGSARSTRWRYEVSEAVSGPSFMNGNEGWTVLGNESDGVRIRVRVRLLSQRIVGDAGA